MLFADHLTIQNLSLLFSPFSHGKESHGVKLPPPMIGIASKTGPKPSSAPGALVSPFAVMICSDIKTRRFLEIQSLHIYLHLMRHCWLVPYPYILQNQTVCASPGSSLKKGRRTEGSYRVKHEGMNATSNRWHQGTLQPPPQGCKQPHPHESGFFIQLYPFLTSLLNACGCGEQSVPASGSRLICVKDQGKNKKGCRRISLQKPAPLCGPGQAVITDNTFHISQREVIYPSQGRPMTAVMLCGCTGYVMMSFQRRNQRLASV